MYTIKITELKQGHICRLFRFQQVSAAKRRHLPLSGGDVVRSEDVVQVILVVELELQLLGRPVLLLPQEEAQQRLTLQRRHVLQEDTAVSDRRR